MKLTLKQNTFSMRFNIAPLELYYFFTIFFYKHNASLMLKGISMSNSIFLKNYLIPICSPEEQHLIVDELESKLTVCDKIEETISQSLQQAETLRQSILKKAFEGKLVSPAAEQRNVYSNQNSNNNQSSVGAK